MLSELRVKEVCIFGECLLPDDESIPRRLQETDENGNVPCATTKVEVQNFMSNCTDNTTDGRGCVQDAIQETIKAYQYIFYVMTGVSGPPLVGTPENGTNATVNGTNANGTNGTSAGGKACIPGLSVEQIKY